MSPTVPPADRHAPIPWRNLPLPVRRLLLHASCGRDHLLAVAGEAYSAAAQPALEPAFRLRLLALAQSVLLAAWGEDSLDGRVAAALLAPPLPGCPALPQPLENVLRAQTNFWAPPSPEHPWFAAGDREERAVLARRGLAAEPKNLFWKREAWELAWRAADWSLADAALAESTWPRTLTQLRHRFAARVHLARGDAHTALASLNASPALALAASDAGPRAACLLRVGGGRGVDEAAQVLRRSLLSGPWRAGQWLRLYDLASGLSRACVQPKGGAAVLLYTYNKSRELDATLASLAASDLGAARLWVLDNGSTDGTADVLAAWGERLGERLSVVRLPVNVGAPAARDWLLSLPEVRRFPFVVFLDDDVALPADWLRRLGAAAAEYPEASVWGCRVADDANPLVLQNVDLTPLPPAGEEGGAPLVLPRVHLSRPDLGQHGYMRPCVSVTGCCHMLRTADIDAVGGFDIRFSPTQFDDLERDLRVVLHGGVVVYQGHLLVRHKRRSGELAERSRADIGNAEANTHKLLTKLGPEALAEVRRRGEDVLEADLLRKMDELG